MNPTPQATDIFRDDATPNYGMLKTLTVLTFIGCALSYIGLLYDVATWGSYEKKLAEAQEAQEKMGNSGIGKMMQGSVDFMQKSHENRYVLAASGLIFTTVCLVGAMRMRQLRKSGFGLYVVGEVAPLLVNVILVGLSIFGGIAIGVAILIALIFLILYSTQRKYLVRE